MRTMRKIHFWAFAALLAVLPGGLTTTYAQNFQKVSSKSGVTSINVPLFEKQQRTKVYEAYPKLETVSKKLKTSNYNRFENPTGIFFEADEEAIIEVSGSRGEKLELIVQDFGKDGKGSSYPLVERQNKIKVKNRGLGYISYFSDNPKAPDVKITISSGKVNGVFSSVLKRGESRSPSWLAKKAVEWKFLLERTPCEVIDIQGDRVALVYSVDSLRKNCPERGLDLIDVYDRIIGLEHQLMGLDKYKVRPKNRMFGRVIWNGFMHADGIGAAFHDNTMSGLANPDKVKDGSWGVAHEFGHVNQIRPGLKWVSTSEVTNNIYSAWVNFMLNPSDMRLEHERCNGGDGNVLGGRFNAYLNNALIANQNWLCQKGPDFRYKDGKDGKIEVHDHFVKLGPLWQLQLYFGVAGQGNPDLYADVAQIVRQTPDEGLSNGQLQWNFMKNACDVQKLDLTDFFFKTGILKPIDQILDDYSDGQMTITEQQCSDLIKYAKKYPKPQSPVIYYISANSVQAYKNKFPVVGKKGEGVTDERGKMRISHDAWKNVTVFETWKGDELVKIAMVGTDSPDNSSTLVMYPEGSTRIEAVAWDGKRTLVHGSPSVQ